MSRINAAHAMQQAATFALAVALLVIVVSEFDTRIWWLDLPSQFRWHQFLLFASVAAVMICLPKRGLVARVRDRRAKRAAGAKHPWLITTIALLGVAVSGYDIAAHLDRPTRGSLPGDETELSIVHINLGDRSGDWQNVIRWLEQQDADVIFLQEARPAFERELDASPLASSIVLRNVRPDSRGTIALVMSHATLVDVRVDVDTFRQTGRELATLTVEKGGRRQTLLSMHMCRPTNAIEFAKQSYEVEQLGRWFDAMPDGVAIGDINCSPYSPRLNAVLRARGLHATTVGTWPTPLPSYFSISIDVPDHICFARDPARSCGSATRLGSSTADRHVAKSVNA